MNRLILTILLLSSAVSITAQTAGAPDASEKYEKRYNLLVSQVGPSGVGVETLLNNWEKADSTSASLLYARFAFCFSKAQSSQVITRPEKKYLGMEPFLTLKDTLGNDIHYYEDAVFDDGLYGDAVRIADKAISMHPDRLDFRFLKANAYIAYEKESPDMALVFLLDLARIDSQRQTPWMYKDAQAEDGFFSEAMQEYCYTFYTIGSTASLDAFLALSERMLAYDKDNPVFLNNIGSYHLLRTKDCKTALKYFNKVLKKYPDDMSAIQNAITASRMLKDAKLERKYRQMMSRHSAEQH